MEKVILYTDGGARGNPGPAGIGVVVTNVSGEVLQTANKFIGETTNNEAEYQAVILGLETLKKFLGKEKIKNTEVELKLDSELVAKQLRGEYQTREERLWPYFMNIWNARVADFSHLTITHIPREENSAADKLANEAMDFATQ